MAALPDDDLEATRAALAPAVEAVVSILPLLAREPTPRFDQALNRRWKEACRQFATAWANGGYASADEVRRAIFAWYAVALETRDADCLRLGEALADAADRLDVGGAPPRLRAALCGVADTLADSMGLEHEAFGDRARHFSGRLEQACAEDPAYPERSAVLDQLFVEEAMERIGTLRDALAVLPIDRYSLLVELRALATQAEQLDLWGIVHHLRRMLRLVDQIDDAEAESVQLQQLVDELSGLVAAVDG